MTIYFQDRKNILSAQDQAQENCVQVAFGGLADFFLANDAIFSLG